ncbi:MAG TPA: hypothetical protein VKR80_04155 [Candidatus Limnocylindria bacterium]|nr:hypothetical protein [Candidatus Limnocylindria bacterium]
MFQAVHTDRSGRVFVAADYGAAGLDGATGSVLERAVPLPPQAEVVPLADRAAVGIDRRGLPRSLGAARWALGAIVPAGYVRTHLPAVAIATGATALEPLPYAAVAADSRGELVVGALRIGDAQPSAAVDVGDAINARLRAEPSNRLLRQLARCARDYKCSAARNAFIGRGDCALPLGAPATDAAAPTVALRRRDERAPLEPVALRVGVADAAAVGIAHLAAGGESVSFGQACEGEPLGRIRDVADVIARIRGATDRGTIVLRTSGSSAAALGRAADAGLDRVAVRMASAHGPTYERVHVPSGYRWTDVRATLREAAARRLATTVELLALPGLTDRATETAALLALLGELASGSELLLGALAADPYALLARVTGGETIGMDAFVERLRADAAHVRLAA